ncbi:uncharacterized protein LOC118438833 [Folsomia candida]|uniref:uncharacterized protein LOC118438833 n=1 Tax=Folsomia candida TaxID=158441 RepID=UPI0016053771|nr:uncharacterized protein LOC118438833 [Folsomia candida]
MALPTSNFLFFIILVKIKTSNEEAIYSDVIEYHGGEIPVADNIEQLGNTKTSVVIGFSFTKLPPQVLRWGRLQYYVLLSESMSYDEAQKLKLSANVTVLFPQVQIQERKDIFYRPGSDGWSRL